MASKKKSTANVTPLTEAELNLVYGILQSTWQYLAGDCLSAREEAGESATMKRAEVIEVVLDADYASQFIRTPEQKAAWARYESLGYAKMIKVAEGTFKYARYGN